MSDIYPRGTEFGDLPSAPFYEDAGAADLPMDIVRGGSAPDISSGYAEVIVASADRRGMAESPLDVPVEMPLPEPVAAEKPAERVEHVLFPAPQEFADATAATSELHVPAAAESPEPPSVQSRHYTYDRSEGSEAMALSDADLDAMIKAQRDGVSFEGERPMTDREAEDYEKIAGALIRIGDEVGVNLRGRITRPEHIHLFTERDDYAAAVKAATGSNISGRGLADLGHGVLAMTRHDPLDNIYGVAHEVVHDVSHVRITPRLQTGPDGVGSLISLLPTNSVASHTPAALCRTV